VEDTWAVRDLPVLNAVVALLEQSYMVTVSDIAGRTGLDQADVARSLDALDPTYVDFRKTETGGDPTFWYVHKVTPEARKAVGQWPTAESLIDRLARAFSAEAEREEDIEQQYQLRQAAGLLGETVHEVAVRVAATITGPSGNSAPAGPSAAAGPAGVTGPGGAMGAPGVAGPSADSGDGA
jgi:predicted transcriptional regulator